MSERRLRRPRVRLAAEHSCWPGELFAEIGIALVARREGSVDEAAPRLYSIPEWTRRMDIEGGTQPSAFAVPETLSQGIG